MGNYEELKQAVADVIKSNGNQEITGAILQNALLTIISTVGSYATFAGIATPETNPGTPDEHCFYIATTSGVYSNFGGIILYQNETAVLETQNNTWAKKIIGFFATMDETDKLNGYILPLYGQAIIKANKAYSFATYDFGKYVSHNNFDAIRVLVPLGDKLKITGCNPYSAIFFTEFPCGMDNVLIPPGNVLFSDNEVSIPNTAKYVGVNFRKSDNTNGYDDMVIQFNNSFVRENDFKELNNIVKQTYNTALAIGDKYDLINGYVVVFGGVYMGRLEPYSGAVKILSVPKGATKIKIIGAKPYFLGGYTEIPTTQYKDGILIYNAGIRNENTYYTFPSECKFIAIDFLDKDNPDGYNDINYIFDNELFESDNLRIGNTKSWKNNPNTPLNKFAGWATVVRGISIPKLTDIFLIPVSNTSTTATIYVSLYKAIGKKINEAFGQLLETVEVTPEQFNAVTANEMLVVHLQNEYDIKPDEYYTLSVEYSEVSNIKWRATDAMGTLNFARNGFFKTRVDGDWIEVSTYPDNVFNYGILWGAYIGGETIKYGNENYTIRSFMDVLTFLIDKSDAITLVSDTNFPLLTGTPDSEHIGKGNIISMGNAVTNLAISFRQVSVKINTFSLQENAVVKLMVFRGNGKTANALTNELLKEIIIPNNDLKIGYNVIDLGEELTFVKTDYITVVLHGENANISHQNAVANKIGTDFINGIYSLVSNPTQYIITYSPNLSPANYGLYFDIIISDKKVIDVNYLPTVLNDIRGFTQVEKEKLDEVDERTKGLNDIMAKAMTLANNRYSHFNSINPKFRDEYLVISGDSITAFQSTYTKAEEGVTRVPPVCDKQATAYFLWESAKWGEAQYRRFDDGKASLVSGWSSKWTDDSEAIFAETGIFNTEYIGAVMREQFPNIDVMQVSTLINSGSFPTQFDISENSWWQRNIPKRFSRTANASIQFRIPAGYSKCDFIYHAHIWGDNVTITTNRNNGIVKTSTKPNDWDNAVEANGYIADLSLEPWIDPDGGNDSYGIPNKRLHFKISDVSTDTVITITKTSNTDKYLIYWGIAYWGTSELPYCLHLDDVAIGSYTMQDIYNLRSSMFKAMQPTSIICEICFNNLNNPTFEGQMTSVKEMLDELKIYFNEMNVPVGIWVPHIGGVALRDRPGIVECNYRMADDLVLSGSYTLLGNISHLFADVVKTYFPNTTLSQFMINAGDVHLNDTGHRIYGAFWNSIF